MSEMMVFNPENLIAKAIEQGTPVEALERLLAMRKDLLEEQARSAYYEALGAFQSECPIIQKTKHVRDRGGSVRYSYATMEDIAKQVAPILQKNGLSYTLNGKQSDGFYTAYCTISHKLGYSAEPSEFSVPIDKEAFMNDSQKSGSARTFANRYAFCNALGIMTGDQDDDGNSMGSGVNINDIYRDFAFFTNCLYNNFESVDVIKHSLADDDLPAAVQAWMELDKDTQKTLWRAPSKGGILTTEERKRLRAAENNNQGEAP